MQQLRLRLDPADRLCEWCGADISHRQHDCRFCGQSCWYQANAETQRRKAREQYHRNRDRYRIAARDRARIRRATDPDGERARENAYWSRNREKKAAKDKRYAQRHPEKMRARIKQWLDDNPDRARNIAQRRQARRRAREVGAFVEDVEPLVVLEAFDGACGICGEDVDPDHFDVDHIIPLARGGEHSYANTQPAHPLCNQRKFVSLPE